MSRSRKKNPYIKEKPRNFNKKSWYWSKIRAKVNSLLKKEIYEIPKNREIINDYDFCDWIIGDDSEKGKRK